MLSKKINSKVASWLPYLFAGADVHHDDDDAISGSGPARFSVYFFLFTIVLIDLYRRHYPVSSQVEA